MSKSKKIEDEKFQARNWKQLSKKELQKLTPIQRSRYLAYEASSNPGGVKASRVRLQDAYKTKKALDVESEIAQVENEERLKQEKILGQLRASEARNRVKCLRMQYNNERAVEINRLISTQPTAIKAVRLQSLLPPIPNKIKFRDVVIKEQRMRIEALMEDELNIETGRILC
ncbi:uncharacterized protein LOC130647171 [Hydractinia symbiolongicarpus]|uniref:uncharacterized protein LOC130647171 n=1 Tax=Hydractinia symbiolongicarpus TaxID=13093 RepID=UPI002551767E|nr:uncharacterized protein LOC130647171 [Hydractinia symbiolongicarpus]